MEITDVRIRRIDEEGKMKAVASITLDSEFVIHDIKVVSGKNGLFIAMPSKKVGEVHKDVAHPLTQEAREKIASAIFEEYYQVLKRRDADIIESDIGYAYNRDGAELHENAEKQQK